MVFLFEKPDGDEVIGAGAMKSDTLSSAPIVPVNSLLFTARTWLPTLRYFTVSGAAASA